MYRVTECAEHIHRITPAGRCNAVQSKARPETSDIWNVTFHFTLLPGYRHGPSGSLPVGLESRSADLLGPIQPGWSDSAEKIYRHQPEPVISTGATAMNTIFGNKKTA